MVRALLAREPKPVQSAIGRHVKTLRSLLELSGRLPYSSTDAAREAAAKAVDELLGAVSNLHDPAEGTFVLVPDTNALIHSPAFESWSFKDIPAFDILLLPTLLSELDALKIEHRNPDVRSKANDVIRQMKEYRRRGPLTCGVAVVNGRIGLRSVAIEPRVDDLLPWLDSACADDRMLAGCVEAMRMHSRSVVALVTGDINLQNKAEFARVPYIEPPELAS
jgi:PIN domain